MNPQPVLIHEDIPEEYHHALRALLAGLPLVVGPGSIDGRAATVLCVVGPEREIVPLAVLLDPAHHDAGRVTLGAPAAVPLHTGLYL